MIFSSYQFITSLNRWHIAVQEFNFKWYNQKQRVVGDTVPYYDWPGHCDAYSIDKAWESKWVAPKWGSSWTDSNPYLTVYTQLLINTYFVQVELIWNG